MASLCGERTARVQAQRLEFRDVNSIRIFNPIVAGNGVIFFVAQDRSGQFGTELWRSDGTFNGTVMVADLQPGPGELARPSPQMLSAAGVLYFLASDGVSGGELWKIEAGRAASGTGLLPRPQLVKDILSRSGPWRGGAARLRRFDTVLRCPGPGTWLGAVEERRHVGRDESS